MKGSAVLCQNARTKKWDKSGIVVDVHPFRQYSVKMDGSGRVSLRNRKHMQCIDNIKPGGLPLPSEKPTNVENDDTKITPSSLNPPSTQPKVKNSENQMEQPQRSSIGSSSNEKCTEEKSQEDQPNLRRSTRTHKPPDYFSKEHKLHYKLGYLAEGYCVTLQLKYNGTFKGLDYNLFE